MAYFVGIMVFLLIILKKASGYLHHKKNFDTKKAFRRCHTKVCTIFLLFAVKSMLDCIKFGLQRKIKKILSFYGCIIPGGGI